MNTKSAYNAQTWNEELVAGDGWKGDYARKKKKQTQCYEHINQDEYVKNDNSVSSLFYCEGVVWELASFIFKPYNGLVPKRRRWFKR